MRPDARTRARESLEELRVAFREDPAVTLSLSVIGALILMSYALARGPTESLFLKSFGAEALPGLWLEVGAAAALLVALYNRALSRFTLPQLFQLSFALSALTLPPLLWGPTLLPEGQFELFGLIFPYGRAVWLRLWSDLYIVLLIEVYWSLANIYFPLRSARALYGWLCAAGTIGSIAGNMLVRRYAHGWGTELLVGASLPTFALMSLAALPLSGAFARRAAPDAPHAPDASVASGATPAPHQAEAGLLSGLKTVFESHRLRWVLWLVLTSQVTVTLIEYQYNGYLKISYPDANDRTAVQGLVYLLVDIGALAMQVSTGFILALLGSGRTLLGIPLILGALSLSAAVVSPFLAVTAVRTASKFLTYSIFKSAKELLYLPLSYAEKTQGKAVIDILVYRQSKLIASALLLALTASGVGLAEISWLTGLSLLVWVWISVALWRVLRAR
jgi:AAA family ATP:ADP antiporter